MTHYMVACEKRIDSEWHTESQEITHDLNVARKAVANMAADFCKDHPDWSIKNNTPDSFRAESVSGRFSTCFFVQAIKEIEFEDNNGKDENKAEKFLDELATLTKRYSISIGGCGCCGSPWLTDENYSYIADDLTWDSRLGKYTKYTYSK